MTEAPTFRTERLIMRGFRDDDRDAFAEMNRDPAVVEHLQGPATRERSDDFADHIMGCWALRGYSLFAIEVPDVAPFIGYVGLWPADFLAEPGVEVGWRLAQAHWGHGYAPEAARQALGFGFTEAGLDGKGLDEIVSFTVPQNRRSWTVMEKIGLRRDPSRDFEHPKVDRERFPALVDHIFYALPRDEWRARR